MRSFVASAIILGMVALASVAADAAQPGLQLSIQPLIVQFTLAPGGQASTKVIIKNVGSQPSHVVANQIDWTTSVDGSVQTKRPGSVASSLNPFLRLSGSEFDLAPGQTQELTLSLALPTSFAATPKNYWGGYLVRGAPANGPAGSFGVGANILVFETVGNPPKHLKLTSLRVEDAGSGRIRLVARMLNDGGSFVRPQIRLQIAQSGRVVQSHEDSTPAVFAGEPRQYVRNFPGLAPGKYMLDLTIDYGGDTLVEGTTDFTVR